MMKHWFILFMGVLFCSMVWAQKDAEIELADKYFADREFEAALEIYLKLSKNADEEKYVRRVVNCYEELQQYEESIKFLDKSIRKYPQRVIYPIYKALSLEKAGQMEESEKLLEQTIEKELGIEGHFMQVGTYLYQEGKLDAALSTYQQGRKKLKEDVMFSDEIANIYEKQGEYEAAAMEYINSYRENPSHESSVNMSILSMLDISSSAAPAVERALLKAVDKYPTDYGLRKMLFEFYVLDKNFMEAFVQVKSIDRLFKEDGGRIYNFAKTLRNSEEYELSNEAFDYIIQRKENSPYYYQAYMEKAINGELEAFQQLPVDMEAVKLAASSYQSLLDEFGRSPRYFNAIYRYARLKVFYLDELESALDDLEEVSVRMIGNDQNTKENLARAKLLIGDILVMQQEYNKAKLIFEEVSELFRDRQLGAMAKYKLAQLSYYKGEFSLAQALLGAIKDNTSNDISNDAIKLNLIIIDNTGLDTTTEALELFAQAQLLTYQRKYEASLELMDSLALKFPNHSLADEIYWEKATIYLKKDNTQVALEYIDRILENFPEDIHGDDALYTKARMYDYNLKNPELAQKYYIEFLSRFPGSLYSVEVRKRIRELRQEG